MKIVHLLTFCASFALIACSGSGGSKAIYHPDVGPFDENGDYVVALADAPVRKNIFSRSKKPKAAPKPKKVEAPKPAPVQRVAQVAPPTPAPRPVAPVRSAPPRTVVIAQSPRPQTTQAVPVVRAQPKPVAAPAPAPKPVVMKPKKKAPVRHLVRKSDTLYGLSRKYGVSVGSIQRANSIKGSTIVTGKTLLIPR
ncbi:MAG: LysM peptidoglycan-binding domain-containing protein [Roseibacillus sp.]